MSNSMRISVKLSVSVEKHAWQDQKKKKKIGSSSPVEYFFLLKLKNLEIMTSNRFLNKVLV